MLPRSSSPSATNARKKLLLHEKVEVRSVEDGFLGSWHPGTIIGCQYLARVVRYDHLLNDRGSCSLTELVKVSPIVDGAPIDEIVVHRNYRGVIRPFPPPSEVRSLCPRYGQCVDYSHEDAWWEGVVIDREEGCEKRRVFFPDMGDEMVAGVDMLRLTRDWDEATEEWKLRGSWLFLELLEEIEKDWPLPVSVKQIWYEVRMKDGFENLRDWISSEKLIWRDLVFRVMSDYIRITIKQFFAELNSSGDLEELGQSLLEYSEPALDALLKNIGIFAPGPDECPVIGSMDYREEAPDTSHKSIQMEPTQDLAGESRSHAYEKLVIEREFCPESVEDYYLLCESNKKLNRRLNLDGKLRALKVKKHLSHIGWKFYQRVNENNKKDLRYDSPTGKRFFSLVSVCKWYVEGGNVEWYGEGANAEVKPSSRKKRKRDESDGSQLQLPKRGKKGSVEKKKSLGSVERKKSSGSVGKRKSGGKKKSSESSDSGPSTHVRQSKRVREIVASSAQQTPRTVLSWLIENNVVLPRLKVYYFNSGTGQQLAEGRIAREGIKCICCGEIFSLAKFEAHTGSTSSRPSSASIFLEDGRSLLQCQLQLKKCLVNKATRIEANGRRGSRKQTNDFICSVCNSGGDLILCDQCPSSFHICCLGLKEVPKGDWFCPPCCCQVCGQNKFDDKNEQDTNAVRICGQCEKRYHVECLKNNAVKNRYQENHWFCGDACQQIFCNLHKILGESQPVGTEDLTWTLMKYNNTKPGFYDLSGSDDCLVEVYSKLNVALAVMHECFESCKERSTRRDLVEDVIFSRGSKLNRMNFRGFYTILLERGDELISTAVVRIYGKRVAEVPLVATRFKYRRLGMCRILIDELEKKLVELGVERLVLPAVPSVLNTWKNSFGFSEMDETEKLKFLDYTFLNFQGTVFCHKDMIRNATNLLTETDAAGSDHVSTNVCINFDEEVKEEAGIVKKGSTCAAVTNESGGCSAQPAIEMDQSTALSCSPSHTAIRPIGLNGTSVMIFYKRRKR